MFLLLVAQPTRDVTRELAIHRNLVRVSIAKAAKGGRLGDVGAAIPVRVDVLAPQAADIELELVRLA